MIFIRIRPNSLSTWIDQAKFEHSIFAKSQHPYKTTADVFKRVITSIFRVGVLPHLSVLPYYALHVDSTKQLQMEL